MQKSVTDLLKCPVCGSGMTTSEDGRSCFCFGERRHCYDLARSGYLNLNPPKGGAGDLRDAIRARTCFLEAGYYQPLAEKIEELLQRIPSSKVVDAGCGEGFISNLLATHIKDAKIYAIDSNQDAINYACKHQSPEIYFSVGNIYNIDAQNDSFNIVCSTEVLEHIHHPEDALKELLRVAQNYVLISVPQEPYFCLGNLLSGKNILRLGNPIDHIHCYTFNGIKKFIKKIFPDKKITLFNCIVWTIILIEK